MTVRAGLTVAVTAIALALVLPACGSPPSRTSSAKLTTAGPARHPAPAPVAADPDAAVVDVAVATLWVEPDTARPVDRPSLTNPVDIRGWVGSMSVADKLWLVGKLATQVLYGQRVTVVDRRGEWTKVVVPSQPSSLDPRGYPGWLPSVQLARPAATPPSDGRTATVTAATTALRDGDDPSRALLDLSYNTRLPVVTTPRNSPWVIVATPTGAHAEVAASDVLVSAASPPPPSGTDLVRTAQMFSGLPYLWAGTASASGFDCSGFTSTVYAAYGIVLPRDADDQATAGVPVDPSALQPGDLLFYATDGGGGAIHHVSMYVGGGLMIQSPATGKTVETIRVDTPAYSRELWGARRYLNP